MAKLLLLVALAGSAAAFAPSAVGRSSTVMMVHRPQLKAAKKANRCRPKKSMPSDINRTPPPYNVEPQFYEGRPDEYVRFTVSVTGPNARTRATEGGWDGGPGRRAVLKLGPRARGRTPTASRRR